MLVTVTVHMQTVAGQGKAADKGSGTAPAADGRKGTAPVPVSGQKDMFRVSHGMLNRHK